MPSAQCVTGIAEGTLVRVFRQEKARIVKDWLAGGLGNPRADVLPRTCLWVLVSHSMTCSARSECLHLQESRRMVLGIGKLGLFCVLLWGSL